MPTRLYTCMVARWYKAGVSMQAVKSVNSATMKYDRKWKSRGKWILYRTNFKSSKRQLDW